MGRGSIGSPRAGSRSDRFASPRAPRGGQRQRVLAVVALRAEVDEERDAVVDERLPPGLAQPGQPVGAHDDPVRRLPAAGERQPTEITDVDAAVPAQDALRRRWYLRVRSGPRAG